MTELTQIIINAILIGMVGFLSWRVYMLERRTQDLAGMIERLTFVSFALMRGQQDGKSYLEIEEAAE